MLIFVCMPTLLFIMPMFKKGMRVEHHSINDQYEAIASKDQHEGEGERGFPTTVSELWVT